MTTRHTPGPWSACPNGMSILADEVQMKGLTGMLVPTPVATAHGFRGEAERQANARLIAAAPEVYRVLHRCMMVMEDYGAHGSLAYRAALEAIAKVEGR